MQVSIDNIYELLKETYIINKLSPKDVDDCFRSGLKKYALYNNFILLKGLISDVSVKALPIYSKVLGNPDAYKDKHRFVIWIQRLNILESQLIYRDYEMFLKEVRSNSSMSIKRYREDLISQTFKMNQKSINLVSKAEVDYQASIITNRVKWEYNRIFLLVKIATYKLYMLLCIQCEDKQIFDIIYSLNKLSSSVSDLYRNKYTIWKDSKTVLPLKENLNFEPRLRSELSAEDFIRPIQFMFNTGYYDRNPVSDYLLMSIYKLDALYLLEGRPELNKRLNKLLEE